MAGVTGWRVVGLSPSFGYAADVIGPNDPKDYWKNRFIRVQQLQQSIYWFV